MATKFHSDVLPERVRRRNNNFFFRFTGKASTNPAVSDIPHKKQDKFKELFLLGTVNGEKFFVD